MQISADAIVKTEITEEEFNEELKIQKDLQLQANLSTTKRPMRISVYLTNADLQ